MSGATAGDSVVSTSYRDLRIPPLPGVVVLGHDTAIDELSGTPAFGTAEVRIDKI